MRQMIGARRSVKVALYIALAVVAAFALFPFLWMVLLSFKSTDEIFNAPLAFPAKISIRNYVDAVHTINYLALYANTIGIAVMALLVGTAVTFMSSFAIAKMEFRKQKNKQMLYFFMIAGLTISGFILLFPIYRITASIGLRDTRLGLVLPYIATTISFNTLLLVAYLETLPSEIDDAAIIDGCGLFHLSVKIVLPMAQPVIATLLVFNALYIFNEFPIASVLLDSMGKYTLALSAFAFKGVFSVNYGATIASSLLIIIPELVFYIFFQRYIVDGMTAGAIKG